MATNVGYRIFERPAAPRPEHLEALAGAELAHIADAMNKFGVVDARIQPVYRPIRRIVGPAVTVKVHPGDHQMVRKAMSLTEPGDVLVIDSRGDIHKAIWGGTVSEMMVRRDLSGVVIDGAARDPDHIERLQFPVWARGVTPTGPTFTGPGEINGPISCGNVVVMPGDLIVADGEGVVVVPAADVATVVAKIDAVVQKEQDWMDQIEAGQLVGLDDLDVALAGAGVSTHGSWRAGLG